MAGFFLKMENVNKMNKCIECKKPFKEEDLSGYCYSCCEKVKQ